MLCEMKQGIRKGRKEGSREGREGRKEREGRW